MNKRIKVNVGTLDDMGRRFVSAWHRLDRGEKVRETHLTFPDLAALLNAAGAIGEGARRAPGPRLQAGSRGRCDIDRVGVAAP